MSDLVKSEKSWVQMALDRAKGELANAPPASPAAYLRAAGAAAVDYVEGGVVGSLLGTTHAKWGLDSPAGPIDGGLAAVGAVLGVALAGHSPELAAHARSVGAKAFTVLAFRRSFELVAHAPLPGRVAGGVQHVALPQPGKGPGVSAQDPIEVAAKALG